MAICRRRRKLNHMDAPARVFVSCGQSENSDEIKIAKAVGEELEQLGFQPFIALANQTLSGIQEFVFDALRNSEYFVFLDFRRERLGRTSNYRGSLFSHQELAIASSLGIEVIAFRESSVKLEGLLAFLGTNAKKFDDKNKLPQMVADSVRDLVSARQWNPGWRNELALERDPAQYEDAPWTNGDMGRYFQVIVRNRHRVKVARDCYVYLEKATRLDSSMEIPLHTFELKWDGFLLPNANVLPGQFRRFDAACVAHSMPLKLSFSKLFSDADGRVPRVAGQGRYELKYEVLSGNFPPARGAFVLDLQPQLASTTLSGPQQTP
jgi:hypothetical protein